MANKMKVRVTLYYQNESKSKNHPTFQRIFKELAEVAIHDMQMH